ncbi:DASH complex subunit ask1, partial [Elasticomyces elasticus]
MSRASVQRPLTLTEELEKLEQSITLTLQEIDHNFSQAHRIVTTSILPLVEQYAENSRDVWEGAKFWKQFFEASANVSLSGYEEKPDGTEVEADTDTVHETTEDSRDLNPNPDETGTDDTEKDFEMSALEVSSTPRARPGPEATDAETSAYETLKKELEAEAPFDMDVDSGPGAKPAPDTDADADADADTGMERTLPITPQKGYTSSPFIPPASREPPSAKQASAKGPSKPSDPIMHRMQDKTYRVQATPLTGRAKYTITPKPASTYTPNPTSSGNNDNDYGNDSSPEPEAPKLHEEIFSSPIKGLDTPATTRKRRYNGTPISRAPGHTPGSSRAGRTPSRPGQ